MKKSIPRPYKSPWVYSARWLAGDENAGKRWAVVNVSHEIIVESYAFEKDAKRAARERQKEKRKPVKLGGTHRPAAPDIKKAEEYMTKKQKLEFYSRIPFPA